MYRALEEICKTATSKYKTFPLPGDFVNICKKYKTTKVPQIEEYTALTKTEASRLYKEIINKTKTIKKPKKTIKKKEIIYEMMTVTGQTQWLGKGHIDAGKFRDQVLEDFGMMAKSIIHTFGKDQIFTEKNLKGNLIGIYKSFAPARTGEKITIGYE